MYKVMPTARQEAATITSPAVAPFGHDGLPVGAKSSAPVQRAISPSGFQCLLTRGHITRHW